MTFLKAECVEIFFNFSGGLKTWVELSLPDLGGGGEHAVSHHNEEQQSGQLLLPGCGRRTP